MFESKYSRYVNDNTTRFAEENEIIEKLVSSEKGSGIPLYAKKKTVYVDPMDNHSISIGPTSCGKSRAVCKILIKSIITNKESAVINDPKGELYRTTANAAKQTHNIEVLNIRSPELSDQWNPLYLIYQYYVNGQTSKAQQAIDEFSIELMSKTANKNDRYWDMVASTYIAKVIELCLIFSKEPSHFTLENILPLCNENAEDTIKRLMGCVPDLSEAMTSGLNAVLDLCAERTKSCIYGVIHTGLDGLIKSESVINLFNSNEIDFYDLAKKPTLIYVIYPDEKQSMNNIVNSFLTQAYTALLDICNECKDDKLPIRVNFIYDEFSNLTPVQSFDNRISESRSKNIRYHIFCQSLNQLSEKYGDKIAETILSNCTNWICFSSKEIKFLDTISKLCGNVVDYNGREKPLISSSELQYLIKGNKGVEVLILRQGVRPYVVTLPYYDYLYPSENYIVEYKKRSHLNSGSKLNARDWIRLAKEHYDNYQPRKPFDEPKEGKEEDTNFDLQSELEKKFDELFGTDDDDE